MPLLRFLMKFYAVARGRRVGIFETWAECQEQVTGFSGAKFKSFGTLAEAQSYTALSSGQSSRSTGQNLQSSPENTSKVKNQSDITIVYTDGACSNNGKRNSQAGIGIWFGHNDKRNVSEPLSPHESHTNNRAELTAVLRALQIVADVPGRVEIYTDSQYTMKGLKSWMSLWKKNGWVKGDGKVILNLDLWKRLYEEYTPRKSLVDIVWHIDIEILQGSFGNCRQ